MQIYKNIFYITLVVSLLSFYSCEKKDPEPEITKFPASFVVVNSSSSDIRSIINAWVYYPNEDKTNVLYSNLGDMNPKDTGGIVANQIMAYKGCERVFYVDCYKYISSLNIELHWLFYSGLDTIENFADRAVIFEWPKDSSLFELLSYDTVPRNKKIMELANIPEEKVTHGRELIIKNY